MYKKSVSIIFGCLLSLNLFGQNEPFEELLADIEQNNRQLQAYQLLIGSRDLGMASENNLPDPQLSAYYLSFGEHSTAAYTEYQLSQSMEFPTVYFSRAELNDRRKEKLQLQYRQLRQEILLAAKKQLLELLYLERRRELETERVEQAKKVLDQVDLLFQKGQVGILDLNKAKVAWLQDQFSVEQIEMQTSNLLLSLQKLNGGEALAIDLAPIMESPELAPLQALWDEKKATDASLALLEAEEAVALQNVKLEKNKLLPDLSIGYNKQGITGDNYSGFFGGISIPLWNSRNKINAAEANLNYEQSNREAVSAALFSDFQEQYNRYELLAEKLAEYQQTLEGFNSEELLFKAYNLGELSFLEYNMELQFYRDAQNRMLEMQRDLNKLKAELLKHQL